MNYSYIDEQNINFKKYVRCIENSAISNNFGTIGKEYELLDDFDHLIIHILVQGISVCVFRDRFIEI